MCARRRYGSIEKSGRDGQDPATCVLFGECDQLAMARLPRATFAFLLSLLPASATVIGIVVLRQIPALMEVAGIVLVAGGVALHQESEALPRNRAKSS